MSDCIFCKILAGEIPGDTVLEDEHHYAFRDIDPKADTHVLVIPREHHTNLDSFVAGGGDATALLDFARRTAEAAGVGGRYRLITNVGPEAGQEVFHLHFHVLAGARLPGF